MVHEKSDMKKTNILNNVVVAVVSLSVIYSIEIISLLGGVSDYASINTEDFATLFLLVYVFITILLKKEYRFEISMPSVVTSFIIVAIWLLISNILVNVSYNITAAASYLWLLKWIEIIIFFILIQYIMTKDSYKIAVYVIMFSGIAIGFVGLLSYDGDRLRLVFGNPNTLAAFFILPALYFLANLIVEDNYRLFYAVGFLVVSFSLIMTGSRSGMLGLISGTLILLYLVRDYLSVRHILQSIPLVLILLILIPLYAGGRAISRFINIIVIQDGSIRIAETTATDPIFSRVDRTKQGIDLFIESPIFGHGWFASPSRILFLDVHYTTILVETGIVGAVLFAILYLMIFKSFYFARVEGSYILGSVGFAWFGGLLVHSVGDNPTTTPHIQFVLLLFLTCAVISAQSSGKGSNQ